MGSWRLSAAAVFLSLPHIYTCACDLHCVDAMCLQEGMAELGFPNGEDVIDVMFPNKLELTANDFLTGIVFEDRDDAQSSGGTCVSRTVARRTKQYFRRYVDDVYGGKIGKSTKLFSIRTNCLSNKLIFIISPYHC